MHRYSDEDLMAYADGELPEAQAQAIREAAAADPQLARRIQRFIDTRRILQDSLGAKLAEPVPDRLLRVLAPPAPRVRRSGRWMPLALAASVVLSVALSFALWRSGAGPAPLMIAGVPDLATMQQALEHRASGAPLTVAHGEGILEIVPTGSLRTATGQYCREFESTAGTSVDQTERARGVACRQPDGRWKPIAVAAVLPAPATLEGYAPAQAADVPLIMMLGSTTRLTPGEEEQLIRKNWTGATQP